MKNLNLIFILMAFICLIGGLYYYSKSTVDEGGKLLNNNIVLDGRVVSINTSSNHSFGIMLLSLTSGNVKEFNKTGHYGVYPYKVKEQKAELYTFIPDGINIGDRVTINSNNKNATYFYSKSKQTFEGSIKIITNSIDIDFIKQNSFLK